MSNDPHLGRSIAAWIGVLLTVVTVASGVLQYRHTKEQEFRKEFWEKQFALYSEATQLAASIAVAKDLRDVEEERQRFWKLYWGPLSMVENKAVFDAMVAYGEDLNNQEVRGHTSSELKQLSYKLARACRESLKDTWEPVMLDDIPAAKGVSMSKNSDSKK